MKTTKKDFEAFCDACCKWCSIFGLNDWRVEYQHGMPNQDNAAQVVFNTDSRIACFYLGLEWDDAYDKTDEGIDRNAFHEVCHLFLADLEPFVSQHHQEQWDIETHRIIRRLENVIWANTEG